METPETKNQKTTTLNTVAMDFWGRCYDELPYLLQVRAKDLLSDIQKHEEKFGKN